MPVTVTDLSCGPVAPRWAPKRWPISRSPAANHWKTAVEVHQVHFPRARHLLADISQADPRRYPRTDILVASRR